MGMRAMRIFLADLVGTGAAHTSCQVDRSARTPSNHCKYRTICSLAAAVDTRQSARASRARIDRKP